MKFTATYDVTPRFQDNLGRQIYWQILRPRLAIMLALPVMALGVCLLVPEYRSWVGGFFGGLFLFLVVVWVKAYFQIRDQGRAGVQLLENPQVTVALDDSQIEYVSSTGTRRFQWEKIERVEETKDFFVLMYGKQPLIALPKISLSSEALAFLREKNGRKKSA